MVTTKDVYHLLERFLENQVKCDNLDELKKAVLDQLPDERKAKSIEEIDCLIKRADANKDSLARYHHQYAKDHGSHPTIVIVGISLDAVTRQISSGIIHNRVRRLMEDYDNDPRSIAYEIAFELLRNPDAQGHWEDHAAIHLFPDHFDEVGVFSYDPELDFQVIFHPNPKFRESGPPTPFLVEQLTITRGQCEFTGPVQACERRHFKYTVICRTPPFEGVMLDPHIIDHTDDR